MRDIINLVQAIRDVLAFGIPKPSDTALAAAYVQVREMAASRLAAFAATLEKGNEYQALQLAEIEPRLPNFIAQISFPEEVQWLDYCRMHQLPAPPPLDQGAIQWLQKLYMRGITANSPFYQDCHAAIAAGDDERALGILRSIVRLNPADAGARQEMNRRLQVKLAPLLPALRVALEQNHTETALGLLDEIEQLGFGPALTQNEVYAAAVSLRKAVTLHRAMARTEEFLSFGEDAQKRQRWKEVNAGIQGIRRLVSDHELTLSPQQTVRISNLEHYVAQQRIDAEKQAEFDQALGGLRAVANRVDTVLRGSPRLTVGEAQRLDNSFTEAWLRVEQFHRPLPEADLIRLHEIASTLKLKLTSKAKAARVRRFAATLTLLVFIAGTGWGCYVHVRAQDYARQLEDLQRRGLAEAANRLLLTIAASAVWGINAAPSLRAKLGEVEQWTEAQKDLLNQTEVLLDDIEAWVGDSLVEMEPEVLMQKLEESAANVKRLAADLAILPQKKLDRLQVKVKSRFKSLQAANAGKARTQIGGLDKLAAGLDFNRPTPELAPELATLESGFEEIAKSEHPNIPDLRLPTDITASLKQLRDKTAPFADEMAALIEAKQAMAAAAKLQDYKAALDQYSKLHFAEVRSADGILSSFPTEDDIAAALLFNGDLDAWHQARQQVKSGYPLMPPDVVKDELSRLFAIRDDPNLKASGAAKNLLEAMRLSEVVDATGEHYRLPLIRVIDSVVGFAGGEPLIKAYLAAELYAIMQPRKLAWGLQYCPQLAADMAELDAILGVPLRSGDWKSAKAQNKYGAKLTQFFTAAARKSYHDLATVYQSIVTQVVSSGVNYAGYVDDAQAVHLRVKGVSSKKLWGLSEQSGGAMAVGVIDDTANADDLKALRKWSPLFAVSVEFASEDPAGK